ncbi:MAG TPA: ribosomal L7Ae/L30e/S12e/Gadd45 family protein [Oscillospiraceae bacterium]|nr:ribosomal L7Ae/L30e/S12e/Gadd45 family protein [Oscillospiraceae bacterium]
MPNKALALLGLARRAGKLTWFEEANLAAIRSGQAKLLLLASDAGEAAKKRYRDKSKSYSVPMIVFVDKIQLGAALGTSPRAAVTVTDEGFAERLKTLLIIE